MKYNHYSEFAVFAMTQNIGIFNRIEMAVFFDAIKEISYFLLNYRYGAILIYKSKSIEILCLTCFLITNTVTFLL